MLDNEDQTKEIKELVVEQTGSGQIRIGHPQGGHDDFADSLAIAAFLATEGTNNSLKTEIQAPAEMFGVKTDVNGVAFTAPAPSMVGMDERYEEYKGAVDNSSQFKLHSETKKLMKISDDDDETDDGIHGMF